MSAPTDEQVERGASALMRHYLANDGPLTFQELAETALRTLHPEALALDAMHNAKDHLSPHPKGPAMNKITRAAVATAAAALTIPLAVAAPAQAAGCSTSSFSSLRYGMSMPQVEALMNCSGVVTRVQAVKNSDGSWTWEQP